MTDQTATAGAAAGANNGSGASGDKKDAGAGATAAGTGAAAGATTAGSSGAGAGSGTGAGQSGTGDAGAAAGSSGAAAGDNKGGAAGGAGASASGDGKSGQADDGKSGKDGDPSSAGAKWEANWRESYAAGDEKKLSALKRYNSPKDALDALFSAQQRIAETRPTTLPKDATAEQVAQYRKDNGIPEKPEAYLESLPKDVNLEEGDKEIITPYLSVMHELNLTPAQAAKLIATRQAEANRQIDERMQADEALRTRTEDELRQEWGPQYRATVNNINGFLKHHFGEDGADAILQARTPDGNPLVGSPEVLRALGQLAAMVKGAPTSIVGGDGGLLDAKGVTERIADIEKLMANTSSEYWKGPKAEKMQAEYRQLIDARNEMKRRAA